MLLVVCVSRMTVGHKPTDTRDTQTTNYSEQANSP